MEGNRPTPMSEAVVTYQVHVSNTFLTCVTRDFLFVDTSVAGLFCSYAKFYSNVQNFVNIFSFGENETEIRPFVSNKTTLKLVLYVQFCYGTKDEFDTPFVESKAGLKFNL